ncbi:beta-ketoacyl synthase N-terminal-like domain-containing protein [Kutzneria chonburiensis]|uniref:Beta-ketoacyl synthase N-terminal-like domain-containing protein n=1 Tax=Kutzneria chonburiensis TaxID=1483604 RepID=A0ABV6N6Q5_9PSEU|nr:beta-ketoacyl synthase N-terminal-like domain-containing protein [Kutzneria chonburiensis]
MSEFTDPNAVAVVGVACRFGPASTVTELWDLLAAGRSGIREHTDEELLRLGHAPETLRRPGFVRAGSVLADAETFDAEFFGYSPQHAEWLEPQQRLLLQTCWHALEDAAIPPRGGDLRTGVFVSVGQPTNPALGITDLDAAGMIRFSSSDKDFAATRVSYKLGLTGPSLTVQTACSSSLVGVHLAAESLINEECDVAVVGGVSLHYPQAGYLASRDMILSPTGACRPFDDEADGTVFGNGVGAVVLRRLSDAIADGDPIRAVIRGSAVNNDGGRKMDFHAPSPEGQEAVIREALAVAGVDAGTVGYVETHGTGTHLGDPIEHAALAKVYGRDGDCLLGSVKNVIGHTNTAAGVAGLIKAVLLLEHGEVPAQQGFGRPNTRLVPSGLKVGVGSESWPVDGLRRAAVSSFGIGGTNAHVVLEQAPSRAVSEVAPGPYVFELSARTPNALKENASQLADWVEATQPRIADVATTLADGRSEERERLTVAASTVDELVTKLRTGAHESAEFEPIDGAQRISAPGYPFARRIWPRPVTPNPAGMIDRNVSTLDSVRFERVLSPQEPVVAEHVVAGGAVLPAAAQLEMALGAASEALGRPVVGLQDITFHQPVRVTESTRLIAEVVKDDRGVRVRILSDVLHAEARVLDSVSTATDSAVVGETVVPPAELYRTFAANGVEYGPAFQVIGSLSRGAAGAQARISWNPGVDGRTYRVSPFLLDGVLQTVIGCLFGEDLGGETFIPYSLARLEVLADPGSSLQVSVRPVPLAGGGKRVRKFDLTAVGDDGSVVLRLTGLALRPIGATKPAVHVYAPVETTRGPLPGAGEPIVWSPPKSAAEPAVAARDAAVAAIEFLKPLLREHGRRGAHVVVPCDDDLTGRLIGSGLAAFGRSLTAENPRFALTTVTDPVQLTGIDEVYRPVRFASGASAFVDGGRYWINGMGHLAEAVAAHLVRRYNAHVVLTGRSDRTVDHLGSSVEYHQLDCTDAAAVRAFAAGLEPVRGVVHCAGVLRDSFVLRKSAEAAAEVIDPKLLGAALLDEVTAGWPLDLFVVFSSVSGVLGSPGQADYAFANAAADQFARHRATVRGGRTLSVAWPYWAEGGMGDATVEEVLAGLGMRPLSTADGIATLESLLSDPNAPITPLVLCGDKQKLHETFPQLGTAQSAEPVVADAPAAPEPQPETVAVVGDLRPALELRLAAVVGEATRTPVAEVRPDRYFEDLGIDSLLVVRIVELLERDFGQLSKTLLFECQTVAELADYFLAEQPDRCVELCGVKQPVTTPVVKAEIVEEPPVQPIAGDSRDIAIIGVAGRFPGGEEPDEFWQTLLAGKDLVTEVPADRWDANAIYDADATRVDRTHTKWGSFLNNVQDFDAPLFNISPREAGIVDPQARLFLESCWTVLEDAGYRPDQVVTRADDLHRRDVGVFVGAMYGEYQLHEAEERLRGNPILANSAYWSIANRVSYFFNFQGPSVAVDTACSSALTAIHMASEAIRAGSCKVAIAGGVNTLIHPNKYYMLSQGRFAASDGRCRSFGAGGDGYVPGEGVGSVLLKPLADALADGDHIHAVIKGTSANHGGRTNGYTVPNPKAQADLITKALRDAGLDAGSLDYIEAHGTGTSLGDPIEIRGLTSAFNRDGVRARGICPIGSVKSNLGHLESAAGVVALSKVLLQLKHRTLVPSIHSEPPNPEIDFARTPFVVQKQVAPWQPRTTGQPLRAGISSFGAGGANAHVVIEEAPARPARDAVAGPVVLFLSARTETALAAYATSLREHISRHGGDLGDIAYTFAVGRVDLAKRRAIRAASIEELLAGLAGAGSEFGADDPVTQWLSGGSIDRETACGAAGYGRRIPLPHYPFERVRCWYDLQIAHLDPKRDPVELPHLRDFGQAVPAAPQPAAPQPAAPKPEPVAAAPKPVAVAPIRLRKETTNRLEGKSMPRDQKISLRRLGGAPTPPQPPVVPAPAPATPVAVTSEVDSELTAMLSEVLYLAAGELDADQSFQDLGVDSILGVEFVGAVNRRFQLAIKATELYDFPTPATFAAHVAAQLGTAPAEPKPVVAQPKADTTAEIRATLRAQLAEVLYTSVDEIDDDETFNALGLDSILGVEFVAFVNRTYGLDEKAGVLYDHPSLGRLATHVAGLRDVTGELDALLAAVRDNQLSVDDAMSLLGK